MSKERAIVNESGEVICLCSDLHDSNEVEEILHTCPEWSIKDVEIEE